MSPKRKQQNSEVTRSAIPSPPTSTRTSRTGLKRQASEDTTADSPTPSQPKKFKLKIKLSPPSQSTRKPATQRVKQPIPDNYVAKSTLLPRGERRTAKVGQQDTTLLRMLCDDSLTGEAKELHFRNMPHSTIDWNDPEHINKINNWRNQIYGRAGMKSKAVTLWLEDEELWFELYYQLSIAESLVRGILLPKTTTILDAFNATFVGRTLTDHHGKPTEPRVERHSNAFASKLNRMCQLLRNRLVQCVFGKSGDIFVPVITLKMLHQYKAMKLDMQAKGVVEESAYANDLEHWTSLFSHLPSATDIDMQDTPTSTAEQDAAATLLSLYAAPVVYKKKDDAEQLIALWQEAASLYYGPQPRPALVYNTPPQERYDVAAWLSTPELSFAESFGSSQEDCGRPVTPARGLDVGAMIVSPG
ncbi:hypothetical protein CC86DRAFT_402813 [Ophiobolus disseminans]|uniref:Uncharacterized protein n=1 Tax=Ophiobolus disseminans TaxID=1469910 RepID=A0A6A7AD56_9PLEO|nr:hypothetical protein CC86DRAFT_402813 [Ophiobolus disseminans]